MLRRIAKLLKIDPAVLLFEAPDPEDAAGSILAQLDQALVLAKDAAANALAQAHQLERQWSEARGLSAEWDGKANAALQAGDEGAARRALKNMLRWQRRAEQLQEKRRRQAEIVAEARAGVSALGDKIEDVRRQRDLLLARRD